MTRESTFFDQFAPYFKRINQELENVVTSDVSSIEEIAKYAVLGPGKRLRPLLFILSSQLCNYHGDDIYALSTLFECFHTASLLHDDVIDNAYIRRKRPSANAIWGNETAILVGDFFLSKFFRMVTELNHLKIFKILTETATKMAEGQMLELENTHNWNLIEKEYLAIITAKTATLISAACESGGILAGAKQADVQSLKYFGLNMGIAFQIVDDVFDYTATAESIGKPIGNDLREGKITLPLIYALTSIAFDERKRLEKLFKKGEASEHDYNMVTELVRSNGAIKQCCQKAQSYVDRAERCLNSFPDSSIKEGLISLNQFVVERSR